MKKSLLRALRILAWAAGTALFLAVLEGAYFASVLFFPAAVPERPDMVLVFGGQTDRVPAGARLALERKVPYLLLSGRPEETVLSSWNTGPTRLIVENKSRTTDQNARFSLPYIRATGVRTVALVTSWYHLPRSLFLARLYLLGTGVKVVPYASLPVPPRWWESWLLRQELKKFWGSLERVALAAAGIDRPYPPIAVPYGSVPADP